MKYDFIKTYKENTFYQVSENEILEVENKLGLRLPYDLRQFLLEVGYGFLKNQNIILIAFLDLLQLEMQD